MGTSSWADFVSLVFWSGKQISLPVLNGFIEILVYVSKTEINA